jgi:hypothetical protein
MCFHWRSHRLFSFLNPFSVLSWILSCHLLFQLATHCTTNSEESDQTTKDYSCPDITALCMVKLTHVLQHWQVTPLKLEKIMSWVCCINLEWPPHAISTNLHVKAIHSPCKRTIVQTDYCYIILCGLLFRTSPNISMSFSPAEMETCKAKAKAWHPDSPHQIVQSKASNSKKFGEYYLGTYLECSA